jgi:hypothetical protein
MRSGIRRETPVIVADRVYRRFPVSGEPSGTNKDSAHWFVVLTPESRINACCPWAFSEFLIFAMMRPAREQGKRLTAMVLEYQVSIVSDRGKAFVTCRSDCDLYSRCLYAAVANMNVFTLPD